MTAAPTALAVTFSLEDVVLVLTGLGLLAGLVEGLRRYVVRWLKVHVVGPLLETRDQVKVNGGTSNPPTLKDTVHTAAAEAVSTREALEEARAAFHLAAVMFEGHVTASEADRAALWEAVAEVRATHAHAATIPALVGRLEAALEAITERNPA